MKRGAAIAILAFAACGAAPKAEPAALAAPDAGELAGRIVAAFAARAPAAIVARFSEDASALLVGDRARRGRVELGRDAASIFAAYREPRLELGRIWSAPPVAVIEVVFRGRHGDREVGVAGAAIVRFDGGLVRDLRVYLDVATLWGQIDPSRLPDGAEIRGIEPAPATGTFTASRSAVEE